MNILGYNCIYCTIQIVESWFLALAVLEKFAGVPDTKGNVAAYVFFYFWKTVENEIWLLTIYAKGERECIPAHILKQIAEEIKYV